VNESLQTEILDRLQRQIELPDKVSELVLAALMNEVEECLGGKTPTEPAPETAERKEPVRAYIDSTIVEGFRGIGPKASLQLTPGPGLTLVVGRNGSGKSSFAEALELLLTGDNRRWSLTRTKIWKEGWRNLHQPANTKIEAKLLIDGQAGPYTASRHWKADDALDDGEATVTHNGATDPISALGWQQPLATYRPFLSYNELGSMLEEGPSKLFDALASILGLDELVAAADALKDARSSRKKSHKKVKDRLKDLRATLEAHDDERASQCLEALKGTKWRLDNVEALVAGRADDEQDATGAVLRELIQSARLQTRSPDPITESVKTLRQATQAQEQVAGTDADRARRLAEILEQALELHNHHGDGDCPVCGQASSLITAWHEKAENEAKALRKQA
jgi:DNA repair exonuclease SbcCD ATPase subunit